MFARAIGHALKLMAADVLGTFGHDVATGDGSNGHWKNMEKPGGCRLVTSFLFGISIFHLLSN